MDTLNPKQKNLVEFLLEPTAEYAIYYCDDPFETTINLLVHSLPFLDETTATDIVNDNYDQDDAIPPASEFEDDADKEPSDFEHDADKELSDSVDDTDKEPFGFEDDADIELDQLEDLYLEHVNIDARNDDLVKNMVKSLIIDTYPLYTVAECDAIVTNYVRRVSDKEAADASFDERIRQSFQDQREFDMDSRTSIDVHAMKLYAQMIVDYYSSDSDTRNTVLVRSDTTLRKKFYLMMGDLMRKFSYTSTRSDRRKLLQDAYAGRDDNDFADVCKIAMDQAKDIPDRADRIDFVKREVLLRTYPWYTDDEIEEGLENNPLVKPEMDALAGNIDDNGDNDDDGDDNYTLHDRYNSKISSNFRHQKIFF